MSMEKCETCAATGYMTFEPPHRECEECDGEGYFWLCEGCRDELLPMSQLGLLCPDCQRRIAHVNEYR